MTSHKLARIYFHSVAMILVHAHFAYTCIHAFSIAITQGLHHNAKVSEPIRGCDSDFRDVSRYVLAGSDVRLSQRMITRSSVLFSNLCVKLLTGFCIEKRERKENYFKNHTSIIKHNHIPSSLISFPSFEVLVMPRSHLHIRARPVRAT